MMVSKSSSFNQPTQYLKHETAFMSIMAFSASWKTCECGGPSAASFALRRRTATAAASSTSFESLPSSCAKDVLMPFMSRTAFALPALAKSAKKENAEKKLLLFRSSVIVFFRVWIGDGRKI